MGAVGNLDGHLPPHAPHSPPAYYPPATLKSDGVWDNLLPDTSIVYEWYNEGSHSATSVQTAIECVTTAFGGTKADVVIGPSYSSTSMITNLILKNYDMPQLSYSATSPELSIHAEYPTFFRTVPSDAYQGKASADVMKNVFGWDNVIVLSGSDSYSANGAAAFQVGRGYKYIGSPCILDVSVLPTTTTNRPLLSITTVTRPVARQPTNHLTISPALGDGAGDYGGDNPSSCRDSKLWVDRECGRKYQELEYTRRVLDVAGRWASCGVGLRTCTPN